MREIQAFTWYLTVTEPEELLKHLGPLSDDDRKMWLLRLEGRPMVAWRAMNPQIQRRVVAASQVAYDIEVGRSDRRIEAMSRRRTRPGERQCDGEA